jgi:hypothetical protein
MIERQSKTTLMVALLVPIIAAILAIGALFNRVESMEKKTDSFSSMSERIIRVETKIDLLLNRK